MYPYRGVSPRSSSHVPNLEPSCETGVDMNHPSEEAAILTPVFWLNDSTTRTKGVEPIFLIVCGKIGSNHDLSTVSKSAHLFVDDVERGLVDQADVQAILAASQHSIPGAV